MANCRIKFIFAKMQTAPENPMLPVFLPLLYIAISYLIYNYIPIVGTVMFRCAIFQSLLLAPE